MYCNRFRDQNFGINDLVAIQDVRNDFNLQDIDDSTVIKDKGECMQRDLINLEKKMTKNHEMQNYKELDTKIIFFK